MNESLKLALFCNRYWADYDLELLLGSIYSKMKDYDMAEIHYRKASLSVRADLFLFIICMNFIRKQETPMECLSVGRLIMDKTC